MRTRRDGALLSCAEAGDLSVLALERHRVTELLVGTAAAAAGPGGGLGGAECGGARVRPR